MKSNRQIKGEAKQLIKRNSLWLAIGLPYVLIACGSIYAANVDTPNIGSVFLTLLYSFISIGVVAFLYHAFRNEKQIPKGTFSQLSEVINSINGHNFIPNLIAGFFIILWGLIPFALFIFLFTTTVVLAFVQYSSFAVAMLFLISALLWFVGSFIVLLKTYSYALITYIADENPTMSNLEIIKESKRRMHGHKKRLFLLNLSFFGWNLLTIFTLGLASLYLAPYQLAAQVIFCEDVMKESNSK